MKEFQNRDCTFFLESNANNAELIDVPGVFHRFTKKGKAIVENKVSGRVHLIRCERIIFEKPKS